jgi:hypothetical protein
MRELASATATSASAAATAALGRKHVGRLLSVAASRGRSEVALRADAAAAALVAARLAGDWRAEAAAAGWAAAAWADAGLPLDLRRGDLLAAHARALTGPRLNRPLLAGPLLTGPASRLPGADSAKSAPAASGDAQSGAAAEDPRVKLLRRHVDGQCFGGVVPG